MKSEWMQEKRTAFPKLNKDIECDCCIVGGGLTGLFCAYQLQNEYARIVLIESNTIGSGASGRNTGKVSSQHGLTLQNILEKHGKQVVQLVVEKNQEAIGTIKKIIDEYKINCQWEEVSSVIGCISVDQTKKVANEIKAYDELGLAYEIVQEGEVEGIRYGARFLNQAKMDPYAFATQLAQKLTIQIFEHTPMTRMEDSFLWAGPYKINYKKCILATQVLPFQKRLFYTVTQPNQSFLAALCPSDHQKEYVYIDEQVPKTKNSMEEFSVVGGYDHLLSEDCDAIWQKFKRDLVLENPNKRILSTWSSQDYESFDGLPLVGESGEYLVATAYNKWGNTWSYVASCVIRDLLLQKENPLIAILSPSRFSLVWNTKFITENFGVAQQMIQSKLKVKNQNLPMNQEGVIVEIDGHSYGCYRDEETLHFVDAICSHLGCTLKFNNEEKTWDCPCHGSRFNVIGEIIKGPTSVKLKHWEVSLNED